MPKQKQITKKQHFVPRFYLKRFANDNGQLEVLDLDKAKLLRPYAYTAVCYKPFYYAQKTGIEDTVSQEVEALLKQVEDDVVKDLDDIYKKIVSCIPITARERYLIATLSSMLWLRGEYMRYQINRSTESLTKWMMSMDASQKNFEKDLKKMSISKGKPLNDEEIKKAKEFFLTEKYSIKFNNVSHLMILTEMEGFANLFYGKHWTVYVAKGNKKFITSDTPVIEWFPERTGFYGHSFLERKHYLALSPTVIIEMTYPNQGKAIKRKWVYDDKVTELNELRANCSMEYCYSGVKTPLQELIDNKNDLVHRIINLAVKLTK